MHFKSLFDASLAFGRRKPAAADRSRTVQRLFAAVLGGLACLAGASVAQAQLQGYTTVLPATQIVEPPAALIPFVNVIAPLPTFSYTVTADPSLGGGTYTGTIMGRSPFFRGKTTTTIPTQIIPLIVTINGVTYDPTQPDACTSPQQTTIAYALNSPVFANNPWTMNGIFIGNTQYPDAFQRAEFWSLVGGTPYHLIMSTSQLPAQSETFSGTNLNVGGCAGTLGEVDINTFDAAIRSLLTTLQPTVNVGTLPVILMKNVVETEGGRCCVLGYHSGFFIGGNEQVYTVANIDAAKLFRGTGGGGDVTALSHEFGEAINDPTGSNPTPAWGNIGQVVGTCQSNFEVGDPLSPGFGTPTNEFTVNGYHLQELAFISWFYGGNAPRGAGGGYSDNGTFTGFAKLCPPGGTN